MADDMTEKIKGLLNNPEMMNMLSSLVGSSNEKSEISSSSNDLTSSVKSVLSGLDSGSDKRINLLYALKPYMKGNKSANIDKAIKMIKLTKLGSIIKDLWGVSYV